MDREFRVGIRVDDLCRACKMVRDHTVVAVGKVAWATEMDPITTDVGLEFIEIDPTAVGLLDELMAVEAGI